MIGMKGSPQAVRVLKARAMRLLCNVMMKEGGLWQSDVRQARLPSLVAIDTHFAEDAGDFLLQLGIGAGDRGKLGITAWQVARLRHRLARRLVCRRRHDAFGRQIVRHFLFQHPLEFMTDRRCRLRSRLVFGRCRCGACGRRHVLDRRG